MGVSSYFEFVTVLFGWVVYDRLWAVLNDTGIVYLPFFAILLTNLLESRRAGDDEGSAAIQSLKKSETDVLVAIVVLFLAAVPFTEVRLAEMSYTRPTLDCATAERIARGDEPAEVAGTATGTAYDVPLATLSGEVGRVPLWWGFVHVVSKAVVAAGVAAIPCTGDVVRVAMSLDGDPIDDVHLAREVADFTTDCHRPSVVRMHSGGPNGRSEEAMRHRDYLGSPFFLETDGYYDVRYSRRERPSFPPDADRDEGLVGSHPTCREWWSDDANGLRSRLLAGIDQRIRNEMVYDSNAILRQQHEGASQGELEDLLLRRYLAHRPGNRSGVASVSYETDVGEVYRAAAGVNGSVAAGALSATADIIDNWVSMGAAAIGLLSKAPGNIAAGAAIREGVPIFLALLLMVFTAGLPLLMVFSRYELSVLMTLTLVFFGLQFFYVLWGMAFWVDNHLFGALVGAASAPVPNPLQALVSLWVQRFLYIVFPMIWLAAMAWVGVRTSGITGAMSQLSDSTAKAAEKGGEMVGKIVKGMLTKGKLR